MELGVFHITRDFVWSGVIYFAFLVRPANRIRDLVVPCSSYSRVYVLFYSHKSHVSARTTTYKLRVFISF